MVQLLPKTVRFLSNEAQLQLDSEILLEVQYFKIKAGALVVYIVTSVFTAVKLEIKYICMVYRM